MPRSLIIARHSFIDVGPPFDFYELIQVKTAGDSLSVEDVLVTPTGQSCMQPATVESKTATLHESMSDLLFGRNPCAIPERDLHREQKRRKHYLVFSGADVTMQVRCGDKDRLLRMDILDRDLFDSAPHTPANTSWTMNVLGELDKSLGPGVWDRPIFSLEIPKARSAPQTDLVQKIRGGKYDNLFGKDQHVSQIALEADQPPGKPPSVEIESVAPFAPIVAKPPIYPPIARAAHVGGLVTATFDIAADGKVQSVVTDGPRMLQLGVVDALSDWKFPRSAWGKSARASILFNLNCLATPIPTGK